MKFPLEIKRISLEGVFQVAQTGTSILDVSCSIKIIYCKSVA
jgi:hypothetical protein